MVSDPTSFSPTFDSEDFKPAMFLANSASAVDTIQLAENTALFVGNELSFPEPVLRSFGYELPYIRSLRLPDLEQLHVFLHLHSAPAFVIFEQGLAKVLSTGFDQLRKTGIHAHYILAYTDPLIAHRTLLAQEADPNLPSIGFLPMNRPLSVWLAAIRLLISGEKYIPPELFSSPSHLLSAIHKPTAPLETPASPPDDKEDELTKQSAEPSPLTPRETEVLERVAQGKQNKTIAVEIGVSEHTVKLHIHNVIRKLAVSNRTGASAWYLAREAAVALLDAKQDA